ncbi:hypothetical protein BN1708_017612 [Verticillium longisporum]|uniref:Uncharacterized protein n=1 Tax=Verticillium longisporum TaxID=100787 RepID=A0A0G4L7B1_VERLO|nr:hypothetical protein BN1708_017612 [Verticillium longisporum]
MKRYWPPSSHKSATCRPGRSSLRFGTRRARNASPRWRPCTTATPRPPSSSTT